MNEHSLPPSTAAWIARRTYIQSYTEGLIDIEDLVNLKVVTFREAVQLAGRTRETVAGLLEHPDPDWLAVMSYRRPA